MAKTVDLSQHYYNKTDINSLLSAKVSTDDLRLSDTRTPTDSSVTNAKVASDAAIAFSKLDISKNDIVGLGIPASDTVYTHPTKDGLSTQSTTVLKKIAYDNQGHITSTANVEASDLPSHGHGNINNNGILSSTTNNTFDDTNDLIIFADYDDSSSYKLKGTKFSNALENIIDDLINEAQS